MLHVIVCSLNLCMSNNTISLYDIQCTILKSFNFACFFSLQFLINLDGTGEFLPTASFMDYLTAIICPLIDVEYVCEDILFLICGFDRTDINIVRPLEQSQVLYELPDICA